jgi:hypothetical protein
MKKRIVFLMVFLIASSLSPAPIRAWEFVGDSLQPASLPASSQIVDQPIQTDFNGDGENESLVLQDGKASIMTGTQLRWQSPSGWTVHQASLGDLNQDGLTEAVLLVWRPFDPWPVDQWLPRGGRIADFHNGKGDSCHIILIGWRKDMFRERWAGSALAEPVKSFAVADMDRDGKEELITLDSTYAATPGAPAEALKVWEWNGFGFSLVSSVNGQFSELQVVKSNDGRIFLLTP